MGYYEESKVSLDFNLGFNFEFESQFLELEFHEEFFTGRNSSVSLHSITIVLFGSSPVNIFALNIRASLLALFAATNTAI